jgi:hypothetical protein
MFLLLVIINSYSIFTGLTCLICLAFLFFESAFGICLDVGVGWFYKDKSQYCAGEICDVKRKHAIQKTSWVQIFILLGLVAGVVLMFFLFNDQFSIKPKNLWEIVNTL